MSSQPPVLSGAQIREKFLNFYAERQHRRLPSASLVPEDPTVLLTIAGMLPFKPIFLGQQVAPTPRATTAQKCIRTNDIENVGRTHRHHTFFEMLGNFSFGDYFKEQAIAWAWELATDPKAGFGLDPQHIVVSVFREDDEAYEIWRDRIGLPEARIQRLGEDDNFWVSGPTGPCGPCSELYYDFHPERGDAAIDLEDDTRFIEFYNLVFMQFNRDAAGNLTPLQHKNIDTGMGLERMAQILQQVPNNYETDLIFPLIEVVAKLAKIKYAEADETTKVSLKVIGDHLRAVVHLIADGVMASNTDRGYILRRLIRRVVRHGRQLGITQEFTPQVAEMAIRLSEGVYGQVRTHADRIKTELQREESQFLKTLERGEKLLSEILAKNPTQITGENAFILYDTYGFPLELTQEIAAEMGLSVDIEGFEKEMEQQRQRARAAHETIDLTVQSSLDSLAEKVQKTVFWGYSDRTALAKVEALLVDGHQVEEVGPGSKVQILLDLTPFYAESGGQVGDRGELVSPHGDKFHITIDDVKKESDFFIHFGTVDRGILHQGDPVSARIDPVTRRRAQANHSATHLLQAALKAIVDPQISQAGSLVDFDRLRFDFNCPRPLTAEELAAVEAQINLWVAQAHGAVVTEMHLTEAKSRGAIAMFGEKYGEQVRVVDFPGVSIELCGGTHVANTAEIGAFKIIAETGIAAGIRRIEAVAGPAILDYLNRRDRVVRELGDRFKAKPEELIDRITALQEELKANQKELAKLKGEVALAKSHALLSQAEAVGDHFQVIVARLDDVDAAALSTAAERLGQQLGADSAVVLGGVSEGKVSLVAAFGTGVIAAGLKAGSFIGAIARLCGGGGGGKPHLAQAGGKEASQLPAALEQARQQLQQALAK